MSRRKKTLHNSVKTVFSVTAMTKDLPQLKKKNFESCRDDRVLGTSKTRFFGRCRTKMVWALENCYEAQPVKDACFESVIVRAANISGPWPQKKKRFYF